MNTIQVAMQSGADNEQLRKDAYASVMFRSLSYITQFLNGFSRYKSAINTLKCTTLQQRRDFDKVATFIKCLLVP